MKQMSSRQQAADSRQRKGVPGKNRHGGLSLGGEIRDAAAPHDVTEGGGGGGGGVRAKTEHHIDASTAQRNRAHHGRVSVTRGNLRSGAGLSSSAARFNVRGLQNVGPRLCSFLLVRACVPVQTCGKTIAHSRVMFTAVPYTCRRSSPQQ